MTGHENPAAIARRALNDNANDGGIDPSLAVALVEAIVDYPTFATACASCGVTARSVRSMLERGAQPGAPFSLAAFSRALAKADADNARTCYQTALQLIAAGNSAGARLLLDVLDKRWKLEGDNDVMGMISSGRRTDGLRARLERPTPLLGALLGDMLRKPNGAWATLLKGAGWVRAMVAAPEPEVAPEPEQDQEHEGDPEPEEGGDDGSGV